jgi:hypothetical protein
VQIRAVYAPSWALFVWIVLTGAHVYGQGAGGVSQAQPPRGSAKSAAPIDLTGYWVSLVTEDWRYRMLTPPKGDFTSVPLNAEGRKVALEWDPSKDEAAGEHCRAYGVGGLMRIPGRIHISWQDDNSLKLEFDAGMQTRMIYFGAPQSQGGDWQGVSTATWDRSASPMGLPPGPPPNRGSLKVVTTRMKPGYLRKNGVPYSSNAVITEYYDRFEIPGSEPLLVISTEVVDPAFLSTPFWTSVHFKKQNDASGWNPTPCSAR